MSARRRFTNALGLDHAKVSALATKPGQPASIRIEQVPIHKLSVLKKAL